MSQLGIALLPTLGSCVIATPGARGGTRNIEIPSAPSLPARLRAATSM